jgi:hypothetical protein
MVPTGVVDAALIPWPLVPATLIRWPLIWSPLVAPRATVSAVIVWSPLVAPRASIATVSTVILSTVTTLIALAVLCPARLPGVSGRRAETDTKPESAQAHRAHDRGSRYSFLETFVVLLQCCELPRCELTPNRVDRFEASTAPTACASLDGSLAWEGDARRSAEQPYGRATCEPPARSIGLPIRAVTQPVSGLDHHEPRRGMSRRMLPAGQRVFVDA